MELVECQPLLEWLANNYKNFGATLEIITDKSQEGSQFVRGFGGIGGEYPLFKCCSYILLGGFLLSKLILNAFLFTRPMEMTGILRYKVDFQSLQADEPLDDFDLDDY